VLRLKVVDIQREISHTGNAEGGAAAAGRIDAVDYESMILGGILEPILHHRSDIQNYIAVLG
jgi:hypothetical protein